MTADAKVGLLLGLFFIVVIAFLVNGLPNFIHEENPTPASNAITTPTGPDMPLDNRVPEAAHRLYLPRHRQQTPEPTQSEAAFGAIDDHRTESVELPPVPTLPQTPVIIKNPSVQPPVAAETTTVRTHVVKSGETLPAIAKAYYGDDEGNRLVVIQKLYEANTNVLKSPDRVCVGDKLVVPSLDGLLNTSKKVVKAPTPSDSLLDRFSNLLERVGTDDSKSVREYTVREGDSLWSIAKSRLGDGQRYKDILQLNKDKLKDADDVTVGINLKLPSQ